MTNCIVLGKQELIGKATIQFKYCVVTDSDHATNEGDDHGCDILPTTDEPKDYDNIELITICYTTQRMYDLMFAYQNGKRAVGALYLGYWNDGVV